jgi:RNA polymerase sigma-70 factor (ECF subfamily)
MNNLEDKYVEALSNGDSKAFEVLFIRYHPKLVYFLFGFIKDSERARDMAQDIFMTIWSNREKLKEVKSFNSYLFKIAKNNICNYFDHLAVNEKYIAGQLLRSTEVENLEDTVFANQLQSMIDIAVSQMPSQRRKIFIMSRIDGLTNSEIAEQLNINKRTVENHLTAALADLRKTINLCITFFI